MAQKEAVSFSNPEEDRSGVPSPADAEPPFNNPSADLILRTSDNVKFRVWKSILREASPVFADMFALGRRPIQPSQFDVDSDGGGDHKPSLSSSSLELEPILDLPELTSTTLRCLLLTIYPPPTYAFTSLDDLKAVLSAAHKYQMDAVMDSLEDVLVRDFVRKETLRVFCIATLYNRPSVREAAARRFLALPPVSAAEAYVDELQDIDARSYHQLLACRRQCASVLAEATRTLSWFQDGAWVFTSLVACGCGRDEISRPLRGPDGGEVGRHIKRWFIAHYERCASALQDKPCGEALEDPALCDQALREATRCDKCRENVHDHMRIFMKSLREYVDGKVSQITTGIYCHS
ncbi:hypothetical protein BD311DRAFT_747015 [Dichomitus squalens]|uniref:BTB domain-containing protein n=1 Tax=Dichomitus squalens TaxID=114155 RepID=A0A4Q9N2F9_9APHY|nr:hypothetical protein BD311DRAFT_747015 [Dichomitus squalens]